MYSNTTASNNSAFGRASLYSNTTGTSNVGLGYQSLFSNTTASNNTAVGYQAGYSHAGTAGYNTFVGYRAGYSFNTSTSDGNNTFVGQQSGYAVTTGLSNTFYGFGSGIAMTTGSGNTIVGRFGGNNSGIDIRTANNYIVLSDGDGLPAIHNVANQWTTTAFGNLDITQDSTSANVLAISQNTATALFGGTNSFSGMFIVNDINNFGSAALILTAGNALVIVSQTGTQFVTSSSPTTLQIGIYLVSSNIVTLKPGAAGTTNFRIMAFRTRKSQ